MSDIVYVDARHFAGCENKLLSSKNAGLWKIIKNIANKVYKLDLPQQIKDAGLTTVFYRWKLHLAPSNAFLRQIFEPGPAILIDSNTEKVHNKWKVLKIVDFCQTKRYGIQYKAVYLGN